MQDPVNAFVDGDVIRIVTRESGKRHVRTVPAEWVAYLDPKEVPDIVRRGLQSSSVIRSVKPDGKWLRVGFLGPDTRRGALMKGGYFAERNLQHWEGDVDPVRRWMTDAKIKVAAPRRCFLDLETDSRVPFSRKDKARILAWCVVAESAEVVGKGLLEEDEDKAEARMLTELWAALEPFDQVLAWNGDNFDFPVLEARSDHCRLRVDPRLWLWLDQLALFKKMNTAAESADEKQSMRLQSIAMSVLGEGKDDFDASKTWEAWEVGGEERERLLAYNVKDTLLLPRIEKRKGFAAILDALAVACGVFPNTDGLDPTRQVDAFMLKLGRERGTRFPSRVHREETPQFKGAYVMQPKTRGITRDVHVADFSGMYPSIILTFNMSPETLAGAPINGLIPEGVCRVPITGESFRTGEHGMLTIAIRELLMLRKQSSDLAASLPPGSPEWLSAMITSTAYKVAVNAFYGVIGSPFSRYFDRRIAESVSQAGVWLLKQTIAATEDKGWKVVYSDTDSNYVTGCTRSEFETFVAWCNSDLYPTLLKKQGCVENHVKLAYEKEFDRIIFCGAKKYVASYLHYKGKTPKPMPLEGEPFDPERHSHPEVKGLEYKRSDAALLARRLQERVIGMLMRGDERIAAYEALVEKTLSRILNEELPLEEFVMSKSLSRPLRGYVVRTKNDGTVAAEPPHVTVGRLLAKRGREIVDGTRIEYVVIDGRDNLKVIPAEDYKGEHDRYYLWENLAWPPTMRLLAAAFPDHNWKRWDKVRPPKPRKGGAAPSDVQAGLFDVLTPSPALSRDPPSPDAPKPILAIAKSIVAELERRATPVAALQLAPVQTDSEPFFGTLNGSPIPLDGGVCSISVAALQLPVEPWVLHLTGDDDLEAMRNLLDRHHGSIPLEIVLHLEDGVEVDLIARARVSGSEDMAEEIEIARAEAWYAARIHGPWHVVA